MEIGHQSARKFALVKAMDAGMGLEMPFGDGLNDAIRESDRNLVGDGLRDSIWKGISGRCPGSGPFLNWGSE